MIETAFADGRLLVLAAAFGAIASGAQQPKSEPSTASTVETPARVLHLPFPAGKSYVCTKAGGSEDAKSGEYAREAVDFAIPSGNAVVAAAAGRVVEVAEDSKLSGDADLYEVHANLVVLDHGEGYFTRYLHLAQDGVDVAEGDWVKAGQRIATSGATGRTSAPKLRFALCDVWGKALPARFAELKDGAPAEKKPCLSKNVDTSKVDPDKKPVSRFGGAAKEKKPEEEEPPAPPPVSNLPLDAFAFNSVELASQLPAHVYEEDWTYVIQGRVTNDAKRVAFFVCKRGGSSVTEALFIAPVNDQKTFSLPVTLADQKDKLASGPYRYALTTLTDEGNYASAKMLPLVITKKK